MTPLNQIQLTSISFFVQISNIKLRIKRYRFFALLANSKIFATNDFKRFLKSFAILFFSCFLSHLPKIAQATDNAYLIELQHQAQQLKLAQHPQWQALLHFAPQHFTNVPASLITNTDFFYHPHGNLDAEAELNATLVALLLTTEHEETAAQCRFPARFAWLQQQLHFNPQRLPLYKCQQLQQWLNNLAVSGITVVFPMAYLNNPASLFGHSFLRLDKNNQQTPLIAWTANYAAITAHEHGVNFAVKGLFGGYKGHFSLAPYYELLKEYADLENRDLWEYTLNFSKDEVQMLLWHLWELTQTQNVIFDYYFTAKNCGYQTLALLQVARPNLQLIEKFSWNAIPADTLRAIVAVPSLLVTVNYRPALVTTLTAQARLLNSEQQHIAKKLANGESLSLLETQLPLQQAQILELAVKYLNYLDADAIQNQQAIHGELAYQLLTRRSALPQTEPTVITMPLSSPDKSHAPHRLQLGLGYEASRPYLAFGGRWVYHDIYDPSAGFTSGSQIEFFKTQLRYYPQQQQLRLQRLDLVNLQSMPAANQFTQPFSWQLAVNLHRQSFEKQQYALVADVQAGGGLSYADEKSLLSLSALSSLRFTEKLPQFAAVGVGGHFHAHTDWTPAWRIGIDADVLQYFPINSMYYRYGLTQRWTLTPNNALVLEMNRTHEFQQTSVNLQLAWQFYF